MSYKENIRYSNYLTIWDVAHRTVGYFPEATNENDLPEIVRKSIHNYLSMLTKAHYPLFKKKELNNEYLFSEDEDTPLSLLIEILFGWFLRSYRSRDRNRLKNMKSTGKYQKKFLDELYIPRSSVKMYSFHENIPLPEFWFDPDEIQDHDEFKRKVRKDRAVCNGEIHEITASTRTAVAKNAANARHDKTLAIKFRFEEYYDEQCEIQKKNLTLAAATRSFHKAMTDAEFTAICPSRSVDNLIKVFREHFKEVEKYKCKRF